jgi:YggT family protein
MVGILINLVQTIAWLFSLLLIVDIILSYFMSPYHPVRLTLDRIVQPVLNPIRRIIPPLGMIDISPIVLLILVQVLESLLLGILSRMG